MSITDLEVVNFCHLFTYQFSMFPDCIKALFPIETLVATQSFGHCLQVIRERSD